MYDTIVIGSGIIGSWTAYHLVQNKQRTLLLEQFPLGHTRGSSHGHSRNFRMTGQADLVMIKSCYEQWMKLANLVTTHTHINKHAYICRQTRSYSYVVDV
jgi:sarcosine oxidase/L-pipecolate oxidase